MKPRFYLSDKERALRDLLKSHGIRKDNKITFDDPRPVVWSMVFCRKYDYEASFEVSAVWLHGNSIKAEVSETLPDGTEAGAPYPLVWTVRDFDEGDAFGRWSEVRELYVDLLLAAVRRRLHLPIECTLVSVEEANDSGSVQVHIVGYLYKGDGWSLVETSGIRVLYAEFANEYRLRGTDYTDELLEGCRQYQGDPFNEATAATAIDTAFGGKGPDGVIAFADIAAKPLSVGNYLVPDATQAI